MSMENVEDPFKNRLSFDFLRLGDWAMNHDFHIKEYISSVSKVFSPLSLNITSIYDLMEELTPSIYYMVSWFEESLKNKRSVWLTYEVKGAHPFVIPDDSISFYFKLFFYNKFPEDTSWPWREEGRHSSKIILDYFDLFKVEDLTKGENILTKIKTRINEELKKILVILHLLPISLKSKLIM